MVNLEWHTEKRKVSDLKAWDKNPRRMTAKQAADLQKSLEKFNLMSIPVIGLDNMIISGHQRVSILKALKRHAEVIDVRVPNRPLTEAEMAEANLRENKNLGEWDWDALSSFDEVLLKDVGFDISFLNGERQPETLEFSDEYGYNGKGKPKPDIECPQCHCRFRQ